MDMKKTFKIKARRDAVCPEVYANFCEATHSPFDLTITFCSLTGIQPEDLSHTDASGEPVVHADPKTRVTLPFRIVPALIKMLETQLSAVEQTQNENVPRPQVPDSSTVH